MVGMRYFANYESYDTVLEHFVLILKRAYKIYTFSLLTSGVKLWRPLDFFCKSWRIRSNILLKLSFENRNLRLNFLSEYSKIFLGIFNSYESLPSLPNFLYFCNWEIRFAVQNNLILIICNWLALCNVYINRPTHHGVFSLFISTNNQMHRSTRRQPNWNKYILSQLTTLW